MFDAFIAFCTSPHFYCTPCKISTTSFFASLFMAKCKRQISVPHEVNFHILVSASIEYLLKVRFVFEWSKRGERTGWCGEGMERRTFLPLNRSVQKNNGEDIKANDEGEEGPYSSGWEQNMVQKQIKGVVSNSKSDKSSFRRERVDKPSKSSLKAK